MIQQTFKRKYFRINKILKKITKEWNKEEDQLLIKLVNRSKRKNWNMIAHSLKDKKVSDCKNRYLQINPKHVHGRWTKEEDQMLSRLVDTYGFSWKFISLIIKNRSEKQIRSRYMNYIFKGILKTKFSEKEDYIILQNFGKFKNHWVKYCKILKNRSPRQIEYRARLLIKKNSYSIFNINNNNIYS